MKKRILGLLTIIALVLGLAGTLVACGAEEKADYSVTVLSPAKEPVADVDVSWMSGSKTAGSAKTGEDGKATASLPLGNYTVALSGYGEGYTYTAAPVSATMREVELELEVVKVTYTVTVIDRSNKPAQGVSVTWTRAGGGVAATETTNASGKATKELAYGDYTVTLDKLPEGNADDGGKSVSGKNPSVTFNLKSSEGLVTYSVTARSEGGLVFKERYDERGNDISNSLSLVIYSGSSLYRAGKTDENGAYTFSAEPGNYTVRVALVPNGYRYEPLTLTADTLTAELILYSAVITDKPAADTRYVIGDIIHDYSFTTSYKTTGADDVWSSSVSEILKEKRLLIINNWGINCTYCVKEMPAMEEAYQEYKDKIEIVAVSNYYGGDSDPAIANWYTTYGYSYPMMRDQNGFTAKFSISAWPTTILVDRYGAIARIEVGGVLTKAAWVRMIEQFIGDDYEQTFVPGVANESINTEVAKPDITLESDHYEKLNEVLNAKNFPEGASIEWYGEENEELYAWPFLYGLLDDVASDDQPVVYASNSGKANSWAILYATVTLKAGQVLTFDYYLESEAIYDVFDITWDGRILKELSGDSKGWQTMYLYSDIADGTHDLAFVYQKDSSDDEGKDCIYLKNVRFVDVKELDELDEPVDMLRTAAYGDIVDDKFSHYVDVKLGQDGYYHVDLTSLENHELAGSDESPLLLVNMLNVTAWSGYSLEYLLNVAYEATGEYVFDCTFTINGVKRDYRADLLEYAAAATASYVADCVPVDPFLKELLVKFMANVSGDESHENEWLEVCYYYSHYGAGEPIGNPILGVIDRTAIKLEEGTRYEADLTRLMAPFPMVRYAFTPEESAVYKFESFIPDTDAMLYGAQIWLYDDEHEIHYHALSYSGNTRITLDGVNIQNFELYYYLEAGHKYYVAVAFMNQMTGVLEFEVTNVGQEVTEFVTCSDDIYEMVLDEDENIIGLLLVGAVDYVKDDDGWYHAKNADGTTGSFIYLDVTHVSTAALGGVSLANLVNAYVADPEDDTMKTKLDYKVFDFRYCVVYHDIVEADGVTTVIQTKKEPLSSYNPLLYKDYTEILKAYIDAAPTTGELKGMIKVNDELIQILTLYIELRLNMVMEGYQYIEKALENEWLRFCWYYRKHDENNP